MLEQQQHRRRRKRKKKQEWCRTKKRGEQMEDVQIKENKTSKNILQWPVVNAKKIPPRSHTAHVGDTNNDSGDTQRRRENGQTRQRIARRIRGEGPTDLYPRMNRGEHHWDLVQTTVLVFYVRKTR